MGLGLCVCLRVYTLSHLLLALNKVPFEPPRYLLDEVLRRETVGATQVPRPLPVPEGVVHRLQ